MKTTKQNTLQKTVSYWLLTLCYMGIIFYLSSLKGVFLPDPLKGFDKLFHIGIYTVLAFLLYISLKKSGFNKKVFLLSLVIAAIYGITDELHQFYVPNRVPSFGDIIADFIGAFLGSYIASIVSIKKLSTRTSPQKHPGNP